MTGRRFEHRQEGQGSRTLPKVRGEWRTLCQRMRDYGWTFAGGRKHGFTAYAPYWVPGSTVRTIGIPGTPGRGRGYANCRSDFRRWCREVGREPNI